VETLNSPLLTIPTQLWYKRNHYLRSERYWARGLPNSFRMSSLTDAISRDRDEVTAVVTSTEFQ
jgi:hypothetical protein